MKLANRIATKHCERPDPSSFRKGPFGVIMRLAGAQACPDGTASTEQSATFMPFPGRAFESDRFSPSGWYVLKRILDIIGALLLAAVFAPSMIAIWFYLRSQGGKAFYRHERVGINGVTFQCVKFSTMVPDAEALLENLLAGNPALRAEWLRDCKLRNDPRVTRLGRFLRRASLDELPQLWNVIKGEMSLVGPRPITRVELLRYGRNVMLYTKTRPGITGLWQISGRSATDYRRRVALDVVYVQNQNMIVDLWILARTVRVVLSRRGAC